MLSAIIFVCRVRWIAPATLAVCTAVQAAWPVVAVPADLWQVFTNGVHGHFVAIVGILVGFHVTAKGVDKFITRRFTGWERLRGVLDVVHRHYFSHVGTDERYQHRVTLFRAQRRLWKPSKRELVIVARSGDNYHRSSTRFLVDDDRELGNEGLAGRAWFTNACLTLFNLPDWDQSEEAREEYCRLSYMPRSRAESLNVKSRSVSAMVVRRGGEKWGVVVVDSRTPDGVRDATDRRALMMLAAEFLSGML